MASEWRNGNFDEGEFKRVLIRDEIKARWQIPWAFGNTENDLVAYGENGIKAVLLNFEADKIAEKYRNLISTAASWDEARKTIK